MKARIAERGQVTIPKSLRERLGLEAGMELEFRAENGRLVAEKVVQQDSISRAIGCLKLDRPTDEIMAEFRGR
jgi:antitoxin PrlF